MRSAFVAALVGLTLLLGGPRRLAADERPDDLLVVVNKAASVDEVSRAEVAAIYAKRRTAWSDGGRAVPIHARAGTPERAAFVRRVLGMEPEEETTFWEREKIRSGERPPVEFADPLRAAFSLPAGVAYVFRANYRPGTVRVVLVVPATE